jgi:hypothetical protein
MSGDEALLAVLRSATVRIDVSGVVSGTGFAIAPGRVVTCYHVVEPALVPEKRWAEISVRDSQGPPLHATAASVLDPDKDLAWLFLDGPTRGSVVRLDEPIEVDDELYAWGFPPEKPEGIPATYVSEGQQGGPTPWIKFKSGQVLKGMSGAPLLNRRVGAVCGVLKRTRDSKQDLGGYGIPALTLFRSFEMLREANGAALSADDQWLNAMTAAQKAQTAPSLASALQRSIDLVIDVGQGQADHWAVTSRVLSEEEVWPTAPVDLNTVRAQVARLFRLLGARDRLGEVAKSRLLGQVLARAILPSGLDERFKELLEDKELLIDISLHFAEGADEDLVHLPWELLYLPDQKPAITFGSSRRLSLSRVLVASSVAEWPAPTIDLAVAVVRAPDILQTEKRIKGVADDVERALKEALESEPIVLNDASQDVLEEYLAHGETDVLHYIGFGRYQDQQDEIAFSGDPGEPTAFLTADEFADSLIQTPPPPRLVVLQPCRGPNGQVPADLGTMALELLMRGVSAVLVLTQALEDPDDIYHLITCFYKKVASGQSLQRAVQDVRANPRFRKKPWLYPALFVYQPVKLSLVRERRRRDRQSGGDGSSYG